MGLSSVSRPLLESSFSEDLPVLVSCLPPPGPLVGECESQFPQRQLLLRLSLLCCAVLCCADGRAPTDRALRRELVPGVSEATHGTA